MSDPIPMRLPCEGCGKLHIDEGEFATKPHHTHSCQFCGLTWRPAIVATVGVQFLPGFKNAVTEPEPLESLSDEARAGGWWYERTSPQLDRVLDKLPNTVYVRVGHALCNRGVSTLKGLLATPLIELRKTNNLGPNSIHGIEKALAMFGLELKR